MTFAYFETPGMGFFIFFGLLILLKLQINSWMKKNPEITNAAKKAATQKGISLIGRLFK